MNLIYVFVAAFLFSSMEVAIKLTGGAFHPVQLNLIRFFIAALILFPISERELKKPITKLTEKITYTSLFRVFCASSSL